MSKRVLCGSKVSVLRKGCRGACPKTCRMGGGGMCLCGFKGGNATREVEGECMCYIEAKDLSCPLGWCMGMVRVSEVIVRVGLPICIGEGKKTGRCSKGVFVSLGCRWVCESIGCRY